MSSPDYKNSPVVADSSPTLAPYSAAAYAATQVDTEIDKRSQAGIKARQDAHVLEFGPQRSPYPPPHASDWAAGSSSSSALSISSSLTSSGSSASSSVGSLFSISPKKGRTRLIPNGPSRSPVIMVSPKPRTKHPPLVTLAQINAFVVDLGRREKLLLGQGQVRGRGQNTQLQNALEERQRVLDQREADLFTREMQLNDEFTEQSRVNEREKHDRNLTLDRIRERHERELRDQEEEHQRILETQRRDYKRQQEEHERTIQCVADDFRQQLEEQKIAFDRERVGLFQELDAAHHEGRGQDRLGRIPEVKELEVEGVTHGSDSAKIAYLEKQLANANNLTNDLLSQMEVRRLQTHDLEHHGVNIHGGVPSVEDRGL